MSPGNRFIDSVIDLINKENLAREQATMARLKERDRRPTRVFQLGDIVTPHPKRSDLIAVGDGIVFDIAERTYGEGTNAGQKVQFCSVFFAPREVDLWAECRRWARDSYCAPHDRPEGLSLPAGDLVYTGRSEPGWLDPPDMDEISLARFGDILE